MNPTPPPHKKGIGWLVDLVSDLTGYAARRTSFCRRGQVGQVGFWAATVLGESPLDFATSNAYHRHMRDERRLARFNIVGVRSERAERQSVPCFNLRTGFDLRIRMINS